MFVSSSEAPAGLCGSETWRPSWRRSTSGTLLKCTILARGRSEQKSLFIDASSELPRFLSQVRRDREHPRPAREVLRFCQLQECRLGRSGYGETECESQSPPSEAFLRPPRRNTDMFLTHLSGLLYTKHALGGAVPWPPPSEGRLHSSEDLRPSHTAGRARRRVRTTLRPSPSIQ